MKRRILRLPGLILIVFALSAFAAIGQQHQTFTGRVTLPEQNRFVSSGDRTIGRLYHSATLLQGGRVLIAGGYKILTYEPTYADSSLLYDPTTRQWTDTD